MGKKLAVSHALNLSARKISFLEAVKDVFESFETQKMDLCFRMAEFWERRSIDAK